MQTGIQKARNILLADDDHDDRGFFRDAFAAIAGNTNLLMVENGVELMNVLQKKTTTEPDLIFLDLNMPRKNGYECLAEIKQQEQLKHLLVVIISTSIQPDAVNYVYKHGASLYIVKPNRFEQLKKMIEQVLLLHEKNKLVQTPREKFILEA